MTLREARWEAQQRSPDVTRRIRALTNVLTRAAAQKGDKRCVVCGLASSTNQPHFVLPVGYIAACLVQNDLDVYVTRLPLRYGFLCVQHDHHFSCLFADLGDVSLDVERLERRSETLHAVQLGQLLVYGGPRALELVKDFHASLAALKQ